MSTLSVTHAVVLDRHPDAVAVLVRKIRRGKSPRRDTDPATWDWSYAWGTWGGYPTGTVDERVLDEVRRSVPVGLHADVGRAWASLALTPDFFPPEGLALIRAGHERAVAEEVRHGLSSPAERAAELADALAFLTGSRNKGFLAIGMEPPDDAPE